MQDPDEKAYKGCIARIMLRRELVEDEDNLDWNILKKDEFQEKIWSGRSWSNIAKNFAIVLLFSLIPTVSDVVTDGLSVNSFLSGTVYTKHITDLSLLNVTNNHSCSDLISVPNPFDPDAADCTHTGCFIAYTDEGPIIEYEVIECFETDPGWGYVTLACIFLPGLVGAGKLWNGCGVINILCLATFLCPLSPLMLIGAKLVALVNPGEHWKKLTFRLTIVEGNFEARVQLLLQLYIIFSRADRQPSTIQLVTLATSLVMLVKTRTEEFLTDQPTDMTFTDRLKKAAGVLPMILTSEISYFGSVAASTALLRFWNLIVVFPLVHIIRLLLARWAVNDTLLSKNPNPAVTLKKLVTQEKNMKFFVCLETGFYIPYLLFFTGLTITANLHPDATITSLIPTLPPTKFSDTTIIQDIHLLNYLYLIVMLSEAISTVLVYIQIWKPCKEHVKKEARRVRGYDQSINQR